MAPENYHYVSQLPYMFKSVQERYASSNDMWLQHRQEIWECVIRTVNELKGHRKVRLRHPAILQYYVELLVWRRYWKRESFPGTYPTLDVTPPNISSDIFPHPDPI
ncbi:hypothetical protein GcM1_218034 [Golovinomyces cichoracearum]|uniref:Uncharacterized protein n=1 Tax=Golovinomyces cichoracearum TaxID=62708 RepID=A0A420ISR2_9PEZI|nr:hypothetical protein GcM1_218034 [Golovinomyces cichoracearum]